VEDSTTAFPREALLVVSAKKMGALPFSGDEKNFFSFDRWQFSAIPGRPKRPFPYSHDLPSSHQAFCKTPLLKQTKQKAPL